MISVIIPAYNAQEYIEECLDSVLAQTYTDLEIIIVNDGSTDRTAEILDEYALIDGRVSVITTQNRGQASARNTGLNRACGEYIFFIDADDTIRDYALSTLLRLLEDTEADLAMSSWSHAQNMAGRRSFKIYSGQQVAIRMLYQQGLGSVVCGVLYKRSLIGNRRFLDGVYYEDLDFMPRLLLETKRVVITAQVLYYYRPTPNSFINSYTPKRFDALKVTADLEHDFSPQSYELRRAVRDRRLSANFNMLGLIAANNDATRKDIADSCWQVIKEYRRESLFDGNVRLKNKVGIVLSLFGRHIFETIAKRVYK